jgi:hypothetical protein
MLVAKFVYDDYICDAISYDTFGAPIEKDMLVLPINEDVSIDSIELKETAVLLEILEENIVECKRNSYFKVNKAIPIRNLNNDELSILRTAACNDPECAYKYAFHVDQKPTDKTRNAACQNSGWAFYYALNVDKKPTNKTRSAACQHPEFAHWYACIVDKKPTPETRTAASKDQYFKKQYEQWEKSIC